MSEPVRPSIVVIFADDLGFSDIARYGGEIDTPHLDRLALRGTSFDTFYVTPRCSPSRAMLLTGQESHAVGIGVLTRPGLPAGYAGTLDPGAATISERLRDEGYATAIVGKWHLASDIDTPNSSWPTRRGFDEFHGMLPGACSYYAPPLRDGEGPVRVPEDPDFFFTDDIGQRCVDVIERAAAAERPFFLYAAFTAPHWPLHARPENVAKYRERYAGGWDEVRGRRFERQRRDALGVPSLPARDAQVPAWEDATDREWEIERMSVYAAQVEALDVAVGGILDALDIAGIADGTLVVFSSDNGACEETFPAQMSRVPFREEVCPRETRAGATVRIGNDPAVVPGGEDTYMTYGRAWANVSNTPFRMYKRWVHEGGISAPLLVSWPAGGVPAGGWESSPTHLLDLVPTMMDAAGLTAQELAGRSILPMLRDEDHPRIEDRAFCWEHVGNAAIRRGGWKLVREWGSPWELFDLTTDRGETRNLADQHPGLVAELQRAWHEWAAKNGVRDWSEILADFVARGRPAAEAYG